MLSLTRFKTLGCLLAGLALACATSPLGRKQLILLPDSQMDSLGAQSFAEMKRGQSISQDSGINAYIQCISKALLAVSGSSLPADRWEIVTFNEDSANAFALPGGKIGVHTGLLKVAVTPGQLAAVIGHEIGHVLARHGNERVSESLLAQGGLAMLGEVMSSKAGRQEIFALLGLGVQVGILLPHSRTQESESDRLGVEIMARAGFDPIEAIELWKNMAKASNGGPPEFLSTHPSHSTRIEELRREQARVRPLYLAARDAGKTPNCKR